eukprot:s464_g36.t1
MAVPGQGSLSFMLAMAVPAQGTNFLCWWRLRERAGKLWFVWPNGFWEELPEEWEDAVYELFQAEPEMATFVAGQSTFGMEDPGEYPPTWHQPDERLLVVARPEDMDLWSNHLYHARWAGDTREEAPGWWAPVHPPQPTALQQYGDQHVWTDGSSIHVWREPAQGYWQPGQGDNQPGQGSASNTWHQPDKAQLPTLGRTGGSGVAGAGEAILPAGIPTETNMVGRASASKQDDACHDNDTTEPEKGRRGSKSRTRMGRKKAKEDQDAKEEPEEGKGDGKGKKDPDGDGGDQDAKEEPEEGKGDGKGKKDPDGDGGGGGDSKKKDGDGGGGGNGKKDGDGGAATTAA